MTVSVLASGGGTATDALTLSVTVAAGNLLVVSFASEDYGSATVTSDGNAELVSTSYGDLIYKIPGPATSVTCTSSVSGYKVVGSYVVLTSDLGRQVTAVKSPTGVGWGGPTNGQSSPFPNTSFAQSEDCLMLAVCSGQSDDSGSVGVPTGMTDGRRDKVQGAFTTNYFKTGIAYEAITAGTLTRDWTDAGATINFQSCVLATRDAAAEWAAPTVIPDPCFEFTYRWPNLYEDLLSGDDDKVRHAIERLEERDRELEQKIKDCCCGGGGGGGVA